MGECGGNAIRPGLFELEAVGARRLVIVRISCIEVRGDSSDLPLQECGANFGVRR